MAHKTLVGGTAYEIKGGKTLIDGTAYSIKKSRSLIGGTAYDVGFTNFKPVLELGTHTFEYASLTKVYTVTIQQTSPYTEDLSAVNALRVNDTVIPLNYTNHTDSAYYWANHRNSVVNMVDGDIDVKIAKEPKYSVYAHSICSKSDLGTCTFTLGTIPT